MTEKSLRRHVRTPVVVVRKHNPVVTLPRYSKTRTTRPPRSRRPKKPMHQWHSKDLLVSAFPANKSTSSAPRSNESLHALPSSPTEDVDPLLPIEFGDDDSVIKNAHASLDGHVPKSSMPGLNDSVSYGNVTGDYPASGAEEGQSDLEVPANGTSNNEYKEDASDDTSNSTVLTSVSSDSDFGQAARVMRNLSQSWATMAKQRVPIMNGTESFYYE
ncbi:hypothetical protein IscW_ISCW022976 [Ixodes scapularis]|uniref:Uncharacterized protein n=1 Tax=Ixodes scapularis TaxID=6945 RepID=B7QKY2_IXOSC|nr:hypothetical protein IscW_ISCW022976 [Ixodes scapularis]|eukprot:XP_002415837.1 hypothetical protein IscW_ISCW022976 [Ixodes scapularis]